MRPDRTDLKFVWDMVDAAATVVELTAGKTLVDYERTKWLRLAIERSIEYTCEAARHVSAEFRACHPQIPWSAIVATRYVFALEYGALQHDKVWRIATTHVPALVRELQPILDGYPPQ